MNSTGSSNQRSDRESITRRLPTDPQRVEAFANFFKKYMSISTVVAAALPIPVTSLRLIPTYYFQTQLLSVYASLFCFLVLAFIFYNRQVLARWMFIYYFAGLPPYYLSVVTSVAESVTYGGYAETPEERAKREERQRQRDLNQEREERRWKRSRAIRDIAISVIPLFLILLSLLCVFAYHATLTHSVRLYQQLTDATSRLSFDEVLQQADQTRISDDSLLMLLYLGIFVTAEAAFVLMAIKEYLQDYLRLDDEKLISGRAEVPLDAVEAATQVTQAATQVMQTATPPYAPEEHHPDDAPGNRGT